MIITHAEKRAWILKIRDVKESDKGWYMCQINTDPMKSQIAYLDVVGKFSLPISDFHSLAGHSLITCSRAFRCSAEKKRCNRRFIILHSRLFVDISLSQTKSTERLTSLWCDSSFLVPSGRQAWEQEKIKTEYKWPVIFDRTERNIRTNFPSHMHMA